MWLLRQSSFINVKICFSGFAIWCCISKRLLNQKKKSAKYLQGNGKSCTFAMFFMVLDLRLVKIGCRDDNQFFLCLPDSSGYSACFAWLVSPVFLIFRMGVLYDNLMMWGCMKKSATWCARSTSYSCCWCASCRCLCKNPHFHLQKFCISRLPS